MTKSLFKEKFFAIAEKVASEQSEALDAEMAKVDSLSLGEVYSSAIKASTGFAANLVLEAFLEFLPFDD